MRIIATKVMGSAANRLLLMMKGMRNGRTNSNLSSISIKASSFSSWY